MKKKAYLFFLLLFIDQISKYATFRFVPKMSWLDTSYPFGGYGIFHDFLGGISLSINRVENLGAAMGAFSAYSEYLLVFRLLIVLGLAIYTIFFNQIASRGIALFLIISGAIGNIIDYFVYGHVIDMIHFNFWGYIFPVFNFADCLITIGIASLVLLTISKKSKKVSKAAV